MQKWDNMSAEEKKLAKKGMWGLVKIVIGAAAFIIVLSMMLK